MTTIDVIAMPADDDGGGLWRSGPDRYDYSRLPETLRDQAKLAQGTVVEGLSSAVRRVIEAGKVLAWAKSELPHGEYLPWVQQACGLKPRYARKLIQAAEWASNGPHVAHLGGFTDTAVLFELSSADKSTQEWYMERSAAGDVPSRAEVAERKRRGPAAPRAPQPAEALALALIRKGDVDRTREALALAELAEVVTPEQVMAEQRLRELGKQRFIAGADADFHRMKDGRWIRLPHAGRVDVAPAPQPPQAEPEPAPDDSGRVMQLDAAAQILGLKSSSLRQMLTPAKSPGGLIRHGFRITRAGRGFVRLVQVP